MKPVMLYAIIAVAAIAIVASFGFQLGNPPPVIPESVADNVLFVCPVENATWDFIAAGFHPFNRYIIGGFFFTAVLLLFGWGWQLYQNLLSDKFKRESFKNIWGFTKIWFWALVIVIHRIISDALKLPGRPAIGFCAMRVIYATQIRPTVPHAPFVRMRFMRINFVNIVKKI